MIVLQRAFSLAVKSNPKGLNKKFVELRIYGPF